MAFRVQWGEREKQQISSYESLAADKCWEGSAEGVRIKDYKTLAYKQPGARNWSGVQGGNCFREREDKGKFGEHIDNSCHGKRASLLNI